MVNSDIGYPIERDLSLSVDRSVGRSAIDAGAQLIGDADAELDCLVQPQLCGENAECVLVDAEPLCVCRSGYEGNGFDCGRIEPCRGEPCLNEGLCVDEIDTFRCDCRPGWTGERCAQRTYSVQEVAYFFNVALGSEFGSFSTAVVRKWQDDLKIEVVGSPTESDLTELQRIIDELNELQSQVRLTQSDSAPNVRLFFSTPDEFQIVEPNYVSGNEGFFWTYWFGATIVWAHIFVHVEQPEVFRHHLLREELTQSLGLMNDSALYDDSIFFQGWTNIIEFSPIDRTLIEMLYRQDVEVGMDEGALNEIFTLQSD